MAERGAAGRLFHAFANAVLARTLPTVREWLASRLGPAATIEAMELDGTRVHLTDVRLPIGPSAILEVERATFVARVGSGSPGGKAPPMWLERLEGRLVVPGAQGELRFCASLVFEGATAEDTAGPPAEQAWVHGLVTVEEAWWAASAGRDAQAPISGTVVARVTSSVWSLTEGRAAAADATIELAGSGRLDDAGRGLERASLTTSNARVGHLLDALFAFAGRDPVIAIPLPWTGLCDGRLDVEGDVVKAAFDVRTPASRLHLEAAVVAGEVERATLEAEFAWVDLLPPSLVEHVEQRALVTCEAQVRGPLHALRGEVHFACPEVALGVLREPVSARADVRLCGEDGGDAEATLISERASEREARSIGARVRFDADGRLDGALFGSVDPAVVDVPVGVICGQAVAVEGKIGGERAAPVVEAHASSEQLEWRRGASAVALDEAIFELRFDKALSAQIRARIGSGTLRFDPVARTLSAARVDGPSFVSVARVAGIEWLRRGSEPTDVALFALPDDAEVDVDLALGEVISGELHIATSDSRVSLEPLVYEAGRWDGSVLRGRLAARDALTCGLFPGPFRPLPEGAATLELPLFGAGIDTYVDGRITTASLSWHLYEGAPPVALIAAASGLRVDKEAVTLRGLEGSVFGGRAALDLRIAYPVGDAGMRTPTGRVLVEGAAEGFGAWLERALGATRSPTGLSLDLELETGETGALRGPVVLSNARSRLTLALSVGPTFELEGSVLGGEVSLLDVYELMPRGGLTVVGKGNVEVRASIEGPLRAPEASLKLVAEKPRLLFAGAGKAGGVRVALNRVLARGRLNRTRLVWSELVVDGYGGRLESQGLFGWGAGFRGVQAKVELDGVELAALPLPGGARVGPLLGGRLNGDLTLRRPAGKGLSAKGPLWLEQPVYGALQRTASTLEKVGLRPPPITGTEPAVANLKGGPHGWMLEGLGAAVRGARVDGDVAIKPGGVLLGAVTVALEAAYLRSSPMLRVPATMVGDVTLPVRLGGSFGDPVIEADLLGALDDLVQKSAIGRGLHRAVDTVMDGVFGESSVFGDRTERRKHERADDADLLDSDTLLSRLARGTEDEDRYLDVLLERGLSPDEIANRIEAARRT